MNQLKRSLSSYHGTNPYVKIIDPVETQAEPVDQHKDNFDEAQVKEILRKIDVRLLPVLAALYLLSFLDRSNIGNADIAGLSNDLGLTSSQYNMALTIFFFPYALFEVPSNVVLKMLRPSIWLPIIVFCWGTVMTLMGIVENYSGLLATRFFLGFTEAGLFPAASYLLTVWYCRHEIQTRLAIFYCAASLAGAFSGLLAFAIQQMDGVAGLRGWRWIFILEGLLTVSFGIILALVLIDSPERAGFLSKEEKDVLTRRLKSDYSTGDDLVTDEDKFEWKYVWQALRDWKIYLSVLIFWGNTITGYGFIFTLPRSIAELGYSDTDAQLLTIPVYFIALIAVIITAHYADRTKRRAEFIIYPYTLCAMGFIVLMALPKDKWPGARYGMLFPVAIGLYPPLCGVIAWNANNLAGSWKRTIGIALQITIGNLGGAVGSNIYLKEEAPTYWTGYSVSLAILVAAIAAAVVLKISLNNINQKRDKLTPEEIHARFSQAELVEMGDNSPLFRYTL